jgi:HEAT repeat protein
VKLGPVAVPALIDALRGPDDRLRAGAAGVLSVMGPAAADAVPALVALLDGTDRDVRSSAAGVLGAIGPAAAGAVPGLVLLLDDTDGRVRSIAADALGRIGPAAKAAIPALRQRLGLADPVARVRAAAILWRIEPDPGLLAVLDEALEPGHGACWDAVEVFRSIGFASVPRLSRALRSAADPRSAVEFYKALAAVDRTRRAADAALSAMLADVDPEVRRNAARAAGDLGADARGCAPALERALADGDLFVPRIAAAALLKVDPDNRAVVGFFLKQLTGGSDDFKKAEAARSLGECGARAAVPALKAAIDGREGELRDAAIAALWGIDRDEVPVFLRPRVLHRGGFR